MGQSFVEQEGSYEPESIGPNLCLAMVVMTMVVVVMRGRGKRRSGEYHDQKNSSKDLLHRLNVARCGLWKGPGSPHESSEERFVSSGGKPRRSVN